MEADRAFPGLEGIRPAPGLDEVHILRMSEGMSCDGDTVSATAAQLPSIEGVLNGNIPGLPKVHVFVVEGSNPNERINGGGYRTSMGNDPATGEPLTLNSWIDRPAPRTWAVVAIGTCATHGGNHATAGNATGCKRLADYSAGSSARAGGLPIVAEPKPLLQIGRLTCPTELTS